MHKETGVKERDMTVEHIHLQRILVNGMIQPVHRVDF